MTKPFEGDYQQTQGFGENPDAYAKFGLKGHNGLDFALPLNTNITAPFTGKVVEVGWDATGYGLYMKIENDKEGCLLGHLTDNLLAIGADCSEGQLIAHSGNSGNSTGPHLHFGYYLLPRDRQNGYAGYIDPAPFLNPVYQENMKLKAENERLMKDLDTANRKVAELNEKITQLTQTPAVVITPPVVEPAPGAAKVEEVDQKIEEANRKLGTILTFIEAVKKFFSMKLEW